MKLLVCLLFASAAFAQTRIDLHAFGSSAPPPPPTPTTQSVLEETLAGTLDGANAVFTVTHAPIQVQVYRNGIRQKNNFDFTLLGATFTFLAGAVPQPGDTVFADYTWGTQ